MNKADEQVLAVPKRAIALPASTRLQTEGLATITACVKKEGVFKRRGDIEEDRNWLQIIPYLIFRYEHKYFLMQRTDKGDYRLINKYSLGIGGHINKQDLAGKTILDWAKREFSEEIDYQGLFTSKVLGIIKNETVPIDQVHLAYVILLDGDSPTIQTKAEHRTGYLASLQEIKNSYEKLEKWSQMVFDFLERYDKKR